MKVLEINVCSGCLSTGKIALDIAKEYISEGHQCVIAYGREYKDSGIDTYKIGGKLNPYIDAFQTRIFDNAGFNSRIATRKFLRWADEYNPNTLWLHNIHGYYINVELLFDWIKSRPTMEINWLLHDCWAFTGHCSHFQIAKCEKWKTKCYECIQRRMYPESWIADKSSKNYFRKKNTFLDVNNLTIYTPSRWLANIVQESFLGQYSIKVRPNTVDTCIFKYRESDLRQSYGLENKIVILGVANVWSNSKGINVFYELASMLGDRFVIVLVGLNSFQERKKLKNVVSVKKTKDQIELVKWYSTADIFVNPSKEETFSMTTLEALSCGSKAIVFSNTACEEVARQYGGIVVEQSTLALYKAIINETL